MPLNSTPEEVEMVDCGGRTPGPSYALKTLTGYEGHDFSKYRAPAYSLGLKLHSSRLGATPGPYAVGNVDRNGRYHYLGWTMESRAGVEKKPFGPSPLSYAPEKMKYYTPSYSLGLKLPTRAPQFGPSPAEYFPQFQPKPGYTIGGPFKDHRRFVSPGPKAAVPTDLYKPRAPAYSLGLKGKPPGGGPCGPGPKYYPGRICHQVQHAYSFGLKHGKCSPPLITYEDNN